MLRSFEYSEAFYTNYSVQDSRILEQEKAIAKEFVEFNPYKKTPVLQCPACSSKDAAEFCSIWGVEYFRCEVCGSIYINCDEETVQKYKKHEKLVAFRQSEEFQNDADKYRQEYWNEFIQWLRIRTFRFLHTNRDLDVAEIGCRYKSFAQLMRKSELCKSYRLIDSVISADNTELTSSDNPGADIVLSLNQLQNSIDASNSIKKASLYLKSGGLIVLNTRAGSGFDILTLKGNNTKVFPFEHAFLPSKEGLILLIKNCGFQIMELTTPGVLDVKYVYTNREAIDKSDIFLRYLFNTDEKVVLQDFQRFLQKNGLSSFVQIIAKKL